MGRAPLAFVALACAACGPSAESIERARVLHAIDVVRDAPAGDTTGRRALLAALEKEPAAAPANARARDACASAYRSLLDGVELERGVRAGLARGTPAVDLAPQLLDAESRIRDSAARMPDCERAVADLRLPGRR